MAHALSTGGPFDFREQIMKTLGDQGATLQTLRREARAALQATGEAEYPSHIEEFYGALLALLREGLVQSSGQRYWITLTWSTHGLQRAEER